MLSLFTYIKMSPSILPILRFYFALLITAFKISGLMSPSTFWSIAVINILPVFLIEEISVRQQFCGIIINMDLRYFHCHTIPFIIFSV